ncbi:MAG: DegV family protein, partial [Syntrophomonas sp.]
IEVRDGSMHVSKKYRGNIDKCIEKYVTDRLKNRKDIVPERLFITYAECSADIVEKTKQLIRQYYDFAEIIETITSCTISSHCGPGTLGLVFIRK